MMKRTVCILTIIMLCLSSCGMYSSAMDTTGGISFTEISQITSEEVTKPNEEKIYVGIIDEYIETMEGQFWITSPVDGEVKKVRLEYSSFSEAVTMSDAGFLFGNREAVKSEVTVTYGDMVEDENYITLKEVTDIKINLYDHYGAAGISDPEIVCAYRNSFAFLVVDLEEKVLDGIALQADVMKDEQGNTVINWSVENNREDAVQCSNVFFVAYSDPVFGEGKWRALGIMEYVYDDEKEEFVEYSFMTDGEVTELLPGKTVAGVYVSNGSLVPMPTRAAVPIYLNDTLYFVYADIPAEAFN